MPKIGGSAQPSAQPIPRFVFLLFLILFNVACIYSCWWWEYNDVAAGFPLMDPCQRQALFPLLEAAQLCKVAWKPSTEQNLPVTFLYLPSHNSGVLRDSDEDHSQCGCFL